LARQLKELVNAGQITKPIYDKEIRALTAFNLSNATASLFKADGTRKQNDLDIRLSVYKTLPKNPLVGKDRVNLSNSVEEVPVPELKTAEQKEADAAAEVKAHMAKKKAAAAKAKK
jgi:hypothetical protein